MTRLSMNEITTFRWSFEQDVIGYAEAGIDAIGVWRQKLSDYGETKGVELLAERRLTVSNLLWAGGFTGSDGRSFRDSVDDAIDAVRQAAKLQTRCLVVYSGARGGHTHNHARRLLCDALKEVVGAAEEADIIVAIEPMHAGCAADWTFLTDLDESLSLLDQIGSQHLKLVFDTYHLGFDPHVLHAMSSVVDRIGIVHLGDGKSPPDREQNRSSLGEGTIPLKEMIAELEDGGYDGYYDVELLGEELEASDYQRLLLQSKETFDRLIAAETT